MATTVLNTTGSIQQRVDFLLAQVDLLTNQLATIRQPIDTNDGFFIIQTGRIAIIQDRLDNCNNQISVLQN